MALDIKHILEYQKVLGVNVLMGQKALDKLRDSNMRLDNIDKNSEDQFKPNPLPLSFKKSQAINKRVRDANLEEFERLANEGSIDQIGLFASPQFFELQNVILFKVNQFDLVVEYYNYYLKEWRSFYELRDSNNYVIDPEKEKFYREVWGGHRDEEDI